MPRVRRVFGCLCLTIETTAKGKCKRYAFTWASLLLLPPITKTPIVTAK